MHLLLLIILIIVTPLSYGQKINVREYLPKNMPRLAPTVIEESIKYSPEIVPWYFFSLIEQESCISLTHSKCWNEKAELKNSRENGVGVGQLTRAWDKNGKLRFDNLTSLSKKYSSLREMTWNNIKTRPDLQVRSMILLHRESYKKLNVVKDEFERLAMSDAAYNGGYGHLNKERIACGVLKNCDPQKWFGNVENIKTIKSQKKQKIYGNQSMWQINRTHVKNVMTVRMEKYGWYIIENYFPLPHPE